MAPTVNWYLLSLIQCIHHCSTQVTFPLTALSTAASTLPSNSAASLIAGYDASNNRIWLIGAYNSNKVYYYDINLDVFVDNASNYLSFTTSNIESQSYIQIGDILYFASGTSLTAFDVTTGSVVNQHAFIANTVTLPCVATDGKYIFLLGGNAMSTGKATNTFQIYDTTTNTWQIGQNLSTERAYASCAILNDYLYIFGGRNSNNAALRSIENVYIFIPENMASFSWNILSALQLQTNNIYSHALTVNDFVYLIGGRDKSLNQAVEIQAMDTSQNVYTVISKIYSARSGIVFADNVIYLFGGTGDGGPLTNWQYSNTITLWPTSDPTSDATLSPTSDPTSDPTAIPTYAPSYDPTYDPTQDPTYYPSLHPTNITTYNPITEPTYTPTTDPTSVPTSNIEGSVIEPSNQSTNEPTQDPTYGPTVISPGHSSIANIFKDRTYLVTLLIIGAVIICINCMVILCILGIIRQRKIRKKATQNSKQRGVFEENIQTNIVAMSIENETNTEVTEGAHTKQSQKPVERVRSSSVEMCMGYIEDSLTLQNDEDLYDEGPMSLDTTGKTTNVKHT